MGEINGIETIESSVGSVVGKLVGDVVGTADGPTEGEEEGEFVGSTVGGSVDPTVGENVGSVTLLVEHICLQNKLITSKSSKLKNFIALLYGEVVQR